MHSHLSDDEAVAKMGHPVFVVGVLVVGGWLGSRVYFFSDCRRMFRHEIRDSLEPV